MPDRIGNLYGTPDRKDRKYGAGGRLEEDEEHFYHYDDEGNLIYKELRTLQDGVVNYRRKEEEQELHIKFRSTGTGWRYDWLSNGMLKRVIRPDEKAVHFRYDALGRRTAKVFKGTVTRWIWDGNVPLHEWEYKAKVLQVPLVEGDKQLLPVEPTEDVTTWVFEAGTFVPAAKIKGDKRYSIVTDYLGTPIQMYDEQGEKTWDCTLDVYGKVANFEGSSLKDVPFRYQGQYEDEETGLYYNRFRYYEPEVGSYLSQDPIRLNGGMALYGYVNNTNGWIDPFGLSRRGNQATRDHIEEVRKQFIADNPGFKHVGGGVTDAGEKLKEVYIPPTNQIPGSTKGGSYTDLTFEGPDGQVVHINTVDKGNYLDINGNNTKMTQREWANANRIQADAPDSIVITIRKGEIVKPGDLSVNGQNRQKGTLHNHH